MTTKKAITHATPRKTATKISAEEARIIQALMHNVHDAFEQLVSAYQHELFAFAVSEMKDYDNAEECVQDTFLRAYRDLLCKPQGRLATLHLRAWLYKILKNVIKDAWWASRKGAAVSLSPDHQSYQEWLEQVLAAEASEDPEREWMRSETTKQLAAYIQHLPQIQQRVLGLRYVHQLRYKDVGLRLDIPTATARNYAYRAIASVQTMIAEQQAQDGNLSPADLNYWEQEKRSAAQRLDSWLFYEEMDLEYGR